MRRYQQLLLLGGVVLLIALVLSTTSLFMDMTAIPGLSLFKEGALHYRMAPESVIEYFVSRAGVPNSWSVYVEEQTILDATNGLSGPLADDFFRAGALRNNLQLVIDKTSFSGGWPLVAISPDGTTVKFMSIRFYSVYNAFSNVTTLKYNYNRIWPRYLEVDSEKLSLIVHR